MTPETDPDRRPARLVAGAVLILLTLVISVVFIKHGDRQAKERAPATTGNQLTHSAVQQGPAAGADPTGNDASAAASAPSSSAPEPPNPFRAYAEHGRGAAPVPERAAASAATEPTDPFKAFLESGQQASAATPPATQSDAPDPFKEALERQQNAR